MHLDRTEIVERGPIKKVSTKEQVQPVVHLLAGLGGGVVSTLVLHPLDLMKIRFAVDSSNQKVRLASAFATTVERYGWKGIYQGVRANVLGSGMAWGSYFFYYNYRLSSTKRSQNSATTLGHIAIAAEANVVSLLVSSPISVVRTRLCLQMPGSALPESKKYHGTFDGLRKIVRYEGARGLYKGFLPGLVGVIHGTTQIIIYNELKRDVIHRKRLLKRSHNTEELDSAFEYIACAAASKAIATVLTYPYQVLRSRMQDQYRDWGGVVNISRRIIKKEGLRGFYKGFSPNIIHVLPNVCIVFYLYEVIVSTAMRLEKRG